jgi:hypothetical protein
VLQDGITVKANRCLLQFWVDFILMTVPHLEGNLQFLTLPLCDTICQEIVAAVTTWQSKVSAKGCTTETEVVMLISCLERVVLTGMTSSHLDLDRVSTPKEVAGLFGYVSTVFQNEQASTGTAAVRRSLLALCRVLTEYFPVSSYERLDTDVSEVRWRPC